MYDGKVTKIKIPALTEFDFSIKKTKTNQNSHNLQRSLHTHNEIEVYINLSGDISFLVENNLYPLTKGDIIIARPGEYHHCVYRSDAEHNLFWILADLRQNPFLQDFFKTALPENFISPKDRQKEEIIDICFALHGSELSNFDKTYLFMRLLKVLFESAQKAPDFSDTIPDDLKLVLKYIDSHINENITLKDISANTYISVSTIERRFKEYLNLKPREYIQKKKLHLAESLLRQDSSVLNAGLSVGFADSSYFIELFKNEFGFTPFKYKKEFKK